MLIGALRAGTHRVYMEIPDGRVTLSEEQILQVIDDARGIVWYVLFEYIATDLDPQHTEERTHDVDASARAIFHDPALDASLPQHCLSRVRFALAWAQEPGRVRRETHDRTTWKPVVTLRGFGSIAPLRASARRQTATEPRVSSRVRPSRRATGCGGSRPFRWRAVTTRGITSASNTPRAKLYELGIPELDSLSAREERADTGERRLHLELVPTADCCPLVSTWWVHDGVARGLLLSAPIEASLAESSAP